VWFLGSSLFFGSRISLAFRRQLAAVFSSGWVRASPNNLAQRASEIIFVLLVFILLIYYAENLKRSVAFHHQAPGGFCSASFGEDVKVAKRARAVRVLD